MEKNYHDLQNDVILEQLCELTGVMLSIDDSLKKIAGFVNNQTTRQKFQQNRK